MQAKYGALGEPEIASSAAAEMPGKGRTTLLRWRKKGFGPPFYKRENKIYYRESEIRAWLGQRQKGIKVTEAAAFLGISKNTLQNRRRKNYGPRPMLMGVSHFYLRSELEAWKAQEQELLSSAQAAEFCGINVIAFCIWRKKGVAPKFFMRNGRVFYYRRSDLESFMAEKRARLNLEQASVLLGISDSYLAYGFEKEKRTLDLCRRIATCP